MKPRNWISMLGEYELIDDTLVFKGGVTTRPDQQVGVNVGNFICDLEFGGGTIDATITFQDDTLVSAAGIILYYQPASGGFVVAKLGGTALISVETIFGQQATTHASHGPSSQILPGRAYHLQAQVTGSRVKLSLDGIQVLDSNLPFTLPAGKPVYGRVVV